MIKALLFSLSLIASSAYAVIFLQSASVPPGGDLIPGDTVSWENTTNVTTGAGTLTASGGTDDNWGHYATFASLPAATDGAAYLIDSSTGQTFYWGLTDTPGADNSGDNMDYGMYNPGNDYMLVYELGSIVGSDPDPYISTDVLSIERTGSTVYYKKNGATFYTSGTGSSQELYFEAAFFNNSSAALINIYISHD